MRSIYSRLPYLPAIILTVPIGCDSPRGESVASLHSKQGSPRADDDDGYQLIELGDGHVLVEFSDGSLRNPNNWSTVRDIYPVHQPIAI